MQRIIEILIRHHYWHILCPLGCHGPHPLHFCNGLICRELAKVRNLCLQFILWFFNNTAGYHHGDSGRHDQVNAVEGLGQVLYFHCLCFKSNFVRGDNTNTVTLSFTLQLCDTACFFSSLDKTILSAQVNNKVMWAYFKMLCPMTCDLTVSIPPAANMLQCCCHINTKTCPFVTQTVVSFIYILPAYEWVAR
jgi:hypothetical protein